MNRKNLSFLIILLVIICSIQSKIFDYFPLCLWGRSVNCSMKAQTKVKIDMTRLQGEWYEVFRIDNMIEHRENRHPRGINYDLETTIDGQIMKNSFAFTDRRGNEMLFEGNKIIRSKDEPNAWYHVYYKDFPGVIDPLLKKLFTPIMRKIPVNYVILNIDPNYEWCLAGEPCKRFGWLLQKNGTPKLDQSIIDENMLILKRFGYKINGNTIVNLPYAEKHSGWVEQEET